MWCVSTNVTHTSEPLFVMSEGCTHRHGMREGAATSHAVFAWFLRLCVVLFALLVSYVHAHAATYEFTPASGSYPVGQSFQVRVVADTAGESLRGLTTGGSVAFDPALLSVVSATKDPAFSLCTPEPTPNNVAGTIEFGCGTTGTASGRATVFTITFKAKKEGTAQVTIKSPQLLVGGASKLAGTPVGASYTVTAAAPQPTSNTPAAPKPTEPERKVNIPVPEAPVVKSTSHPDQTRWYNVSDGVLSWDIPYGVTAMKTGFGDVSDAEPTELHEPPISTWKKSGLADGEWHFHIAYKNRGGWSSSTRYSFKIDTTPPEEFSVTGVGGDNTAQARFEAVDALSGIELYQIVIDGGRPRDVQLSELVGGAFTVSNLEPGKHTIQVTARDRAGNTRDASTDVEVTGVTKQAEATEVRTSGFGIVYWISLICAAIIAILITIMVQDKRRHTEEKDRIKREAAEAGDKLINIFGVLRDEIEERVLDLSHKPNMTDNERNILESLKDALDISEELIDKEIEDVRKLLK